MRATPMAVFTSLLDEAEAKNCIEHEVAFLHPNQTVKDVIFSYDIAIHHLIKNPTFSTRAQDAFNLAF